MNNKFLQSLLALSTVVTPVTVMAATTQASASVAPAEKFAQNLPDKLSATGPIHAAMFERFWWRSDFVEVQPPESADVQNMTPTAAFELVKLG